MTDLQQRIEELLFEGLTEAEIAASMNISVEEVEAQICMMEEADYDQDDYYDESDDAYALASAGFGMDEDYGYAFDDY